MARTRRTWLWVIGGAVALILVAIVGLAAVSVFYVSRHVQATSMSTGEAIASFESARARFDGQNPLYEVDANDQPFTTVDLASLPTADVRPTALFIQAWNPDEARLVKMSIPFWILRLAPTEMKVEAKTDSRHFDFHDLHLDIEQLDRIGPALVMDYRTDEGARVLLWTD
jgi:hypothetical protein